MSATGTRLHGKFAKPSEREVLDTVRSWEGRVVPSGSGHKTLPGPTAIDLARLLSASEEYVRPMCQALCARGLLVRIVMPPYTCYRLPDDGGPRAA